MRSVLPIYRESFFVSPFRDDGLKLEAIYEDHLVWTDMSVDTRYEGYESVVHGALVFGVMDVLIWYVIFMETQKICMTRTAEMEYLKPVMCDTTYRARARVDRVEGRDTYASAWVEDAEGETYARVSVVFREAKGLDYADFVSKLDFRKCEPWVEKHFHAAVQAWRQGQG
jgi:acyl-coenzyme A thioesterase PaaI-like protein